MLFVRSNTTEYLIFNLGHYVMTHQVFVSYSRTDSEIMKRICEYLRRSHLLLWTDENLVPGTPSWSKAIEKALDNSKCLIVLLSPDSKSSDWVDKEINYAHSSVKIPIYPILVRGDETNSIPFMLTHTQYVDIRTQFEEPLTKLSNAIKQTISPDEEKTATNKPLDSIDIKAASPQTEAAIYERSSRSDVRHNWTVYSLKDIIKRVSKNAGDERNKGKVYPVYSTSGIVEYSESYQYDGEYLLLQNAGPSLISSRFSPVSKVDGRFSVKENLTVVGLQDQSQVLLDYIYAFLLTVDLRQAVSGFSSPRLNWRILGDLPIALPPVEEQERIVSTVKAHQEIFEQHRRLLANELETLSHLDKTLLTAVVNGL
jgi:hypothetical protein